MSTQIEQFVSINYNGEVSKGTLWEALKACIRGQVISHAKSTHRSRLKSLSEITDEIQEIDRQNSITKR